MFERAHHLRIAQVLQTLDGALLREWNCLFGGGTALVWQRIRALRRVLPK